jgi:hypothetical protein
LVEELVAQRRDAGINRYDTLALSGGADDGAYGAGLLSAWSVRGDRPEFVMVTGVSTGALTAPFAFLGPDYDDDLRQVYGGFPADRIFRPRSLVGILFGTSAVHVGPLRDLIANYADEEMLAAVAAEHRRGRRLFVQSTNLDAQRPVLWDLGAIAASGAPNALDVFRDALLASASVPGAFPPVVFSVDHDAEGGPFDELHVDGGVVSESTTLEAWQAVVATGYEDELREGMDGPLRFYVVRNGRISPQYAVTRNSLLGVAGRSVSTLIKFQGIADLERAYDAARLRDAEYYATWIGKEFDAPSDGPFDPEYMKALFAYGYEKFLTGHAWSERPPGLNADLTEEFAPLER